MASVPESFVFSVAIIHKSFRSLRNLCGEAMSGRGAGFQTCCIADFQIGAACDGARLAGLETHDTADLEVCATSVAAWPRLVLFGGYNFTGFPVSADLSAAKMTS